LYNGHILKRSGELRTQRVDIRIGVDFLPVSQKSICPTHQGLAKSLKLHDIRCQDHTGYAGPVQHHLGVVLMSVRGAGLWTHLNQP
jgi:hypothetical protein